MNHLTFKRTKFFALKKYKQAYIKN